MRCGRRSCPRMLSVSETCGHRPALNCWKRRRESQGSVLLTRAFRHTSLSFFATGHLAWWSAISLGGCSGPTYKAAFSPLMRRLGIAGIVAVVADVMARPVIALIFTAHL